MQKFCFYSYFDMNMRIFWVIWGKSYMILAWTCWKTFLLKSLDHFCNFFSWKNTRIFFRTNWFFFHQMKGQVRFLFGKLTHSEYKWKTNHYSELGKFFLNLYGRSLSFDPARTEPVRSLQFEYQSIIKEFKIWNKNQRMCTFINSKLFKGVNWT